MLPFFDIIFIMSEIAVDGVGYAAWLVYSLVVIISYGCMLIFKSSVMLLEAVRVIKMDAKTVVPLLEVFRAFRMRDSYPQIATTWQEISG